MKVDHGFFILLIFVIDQQNPLNTYVTSVQDITKRLA